MPRHDGRSDDALRPVEIAPGFIANPAGSALVTAGRTRVICTASVEDRVPQFRYGSGEGWVTAEYGMLPGSSDSRIGREAARGKQSGRTMEIQRLIGRALRSVVDMRALGERTLWIDCDVIEADGGTRTAAITGGFVAMGLALAKLRRERVVTRPMLTGQIAAVSVGVVEGRPVLDLDYVEDSAAEVDMNVVRTADGRYVEVQGTAEGEPFPRAHLDALLGLADDGIERLCAMQREALGGALADITIPA